MQKNCPQAYNYHKSWQACENAGWALLASGPVVCLAVGLSMLACCSSGDARLTGFSFVVIGAAMTVTAIPLAACGNVYKNRVDEVYNTYCSERKYAYNLELKLNASQNGLGLALGI